MKTYQATLLATTLCISALGLAEEKAISQSDLPPAVEKTLQQQLKGATVKGFSAEKEDGRVVYEAQLLVNGHTKDIQLDASGTIQGLRLTSHRSQGQSQGKSEERKDHQGRVAHQAGQARSVRSTSGEER
jgi:hypothetical protein